jgi:hypothetical protein
MTDIDHRFVETNGIGMHIAEARPEILVLLLQCFPEPCYSRRYQLTPLALAGYHCSIGETDEEAKSFPFIWFP